MKLIRILGYADGTESRHDGCFVSYYDPNGSEYDPRFGDLRFDLTTTPDPEKAQRYVTAAQAHRAWTERSKTQPYRPWDGRPNRPLTAYSCEIVDVPE